MDDLDLSTTREENFPSVVASVIPSDTRAGMGINQTEDESPSIPSVLSQSLLSPELQYIVKNVLGLPSDNQLCDALEHHGFFDVPDIMQLSAENISKDELSFSRRSPDSNRLVRTSLSLGIKMKLVTFLAYVRWLDSTDQSYTWTSLRRADFDHFRAHEYIKYSSPTTIPPSAPRPPNGSPRIAAVASSTPADVVREFRKTVKRDSSIYPVLHDDKGWDSYSRAVKAHAHTHGVEKILDPSFVPILDDEKALFAEHQKFMYPMFLRTLQTDFGQRTVRAYETSMDAQAVWRDICEHALSSTRAEHSSTKLMSYITTASLANWKGTAHAFILHWEEQVRQYHKLIDHDAEFMYSPGMLQKILQNAVVDIPALRAVQDTNELLRVSGSPKVKFDKYFTLLLSAASTYDRQYLSRSSRPPHRSRRSVNAHETLSIDTSVDDLHDSSADLEVQLAKSQWTALSPAAQNRWDEFTAEEKDIIRGLRTPSGEPSKNDRSGKRPSKPFSDKRKVNLHDLSVYELLQALSPEEEPEPEPDPEVTEVNKSVSFDKDAASTSKKHDIDRKLPPGDLRRVLAHAMEHAEEEQKELKVKHYNVNTTNAVYRLKHKPSLAGKGSLVDRGANGGVAGEDVRVIQRTDRKVNVTGIQEHQISDLDIVTAGGVTRTQRGDVILILHQYAYMARGKTIHSSVQLEDFKNEVNEKSVRLVGGKQRITTLEGYAIPLDIIDGLAYMKLRPFSDSEWEELPHVVMTSDKDWDPSVFDSVISNDETWYDAISDESEFLQESPFNETGEYRHTTDVNTHTLDWDPGEDVLLDYCVLLNRQERHSPQVLTEFHEATPFMNEHGEIEAYDAEVGDATNEKDWQHPYDPGGRDNNQTNNQNNNSIPQDNEDDSICDDPFDRMSKPIKIEPSKLADHAYDKLRRFFAWFPSDTVKRTFQATTQYARYPAGEHLKKMYKSPFPALNVQRRNEDVATDTVYSDTPALLDGSTMAQVFVGTPSLVTDVYGMKTEKQFVSTLQDIIRERGAMTRLLSDRAQVEISARVKDILRALYIGDWQSEPYHQHQNPSERRYQTLKAATNRILNRTGAPPETWLLALQYVSYVLNRLAHESLGWRSPLEVLTGITPDISAMLRFSFWEPVFYKHDETDFPSSSDEGSGHFVGFAENVGNNMCFKVYSSDTKAFIHTSRLRPRSKDAPNYRADPTDGEETPSHKFVKSRFDDKEGNVSGSGLVTISPEDLIGRTFLQGVHNEDGTRFRYRVIRALKNHESELSDDPDRIRFLCSVNDDEFEDIVSYNEILERIEKENNSEATMWKYKSIKAHEGPLTPRHPSWKGSSYNVLVEWETGEETYEPLSIIAADDPVSCAIYAAKNSLLDRPGWKRFKPIVKNQKKLKRMINQAMLRSYRTAPKYMFGVQIPRDHAEAVFLDEKNGNTKWQDSEKLELKQLDDYVTFEDIGYKAATPKGYKRIRVRMIYAVKHDGRHKSRLVAGGHLTDVPVESVYSGVVSLRGIRLLIFLAELNGLETWATDIGNAYLEARTKEKVCIKAGDEFGELKGHTLIIVKALYGLRSSGKRWHERFSEVLRNMGFFPSKADSDIWMRENNGLYEYVAVYVDDLAFCVRDPSAFLKELEQRYQFKLKGSGPISYHLGCDFFRNKEGTLCFAPRKYIAKMQDSYHRMFGTKPTGNLFSPIERGDHPETDTSDFLGPDDIKKYQSMIGAMQWAISLGRLDITTAVMTLSSFRVAPRKGHLERAKRVYCYLCKFSHSVLEFKTGIPDYSEYPDEGYEWMNSVYGCVKELIPKDAPKALGKPVLTTTYVDANLHHCLLTGRSVTGILHLVNQTPIDWYSKKQATVETATYGSEFVAARTATDQVIDLRLTLRYLGVPVMEQSFMFGDNKSVVDSASIPQAKLHKRHNALSFHRVREAIASKMLRFIHLPGTSNPADILSKHWGYSQVWQLLQPLMFAGFKPAPGELQEEEK